MPKSRTRHGSTSNMDRKREIHTRLSSCMRVGRSLGTQASAILAPHTDCGASRSATDNTTKEHNKTKEQKKHDQVLRTQMNQHINLYHAMQCNTAHLYPSMRRLSLV